MIGSTRVAIPSLVRVKSGALARMGIYLSRLCHRHVLVFHSAGLTPSLLGTLQSSLAESNIEGVRWNEVAENSFEWAISQFTTLPPAASAIVGLGGGKALDAAKYVAFLAKRPYFAVPTSLSNDGFCSPQASLTIAGKRKSLAASMPFGVVVDVAVCVNAPPLLGLSGVGDLAAKLTAISDWKLAFHQVGEVVDDFAALLSDGAVQAFMSRPVLDEQGFRLLANSLIMNGIAMEVCGSSRPASGSEHLISHALDGLSGRPRLHGLQVGVATYLVSLLQGHNSDVIADLFEKTGFWDAIADDPFIPSEWLEAVRRAPAVKENFFTVLSTRDVMPEVAAAIRDDPWLVKCFLN
jgi:glycerol-1-phosphate dehydrogenase [NAD(P)+]